MSDVEDGMFSHSFVLTEDFFVAKEERTILRSPSPRQIQENNEIQALQKRLEEGRPIDLAVKESQLIALQEEILILKDRLSYLENENQSLRALKVKCEVKDLASYCLQCVGCKNTLCSGGDVVKMIDDECMDNGRVGEYENRNSCLSTGCWKDNVIIGSAKDALIFTEVFYASSVFCNKCLVEVGYCFRQNDKSSIFQTIVNGLYIFNRFDLSSTPK